MPHGLVLINIGRFPEIIDCRQFYVIKLDDAQSEKCKNYWIFELQRGIVGLKKANEANEGERE
eukprot:UN02453